jgi:hypothetical protein
LGDAWISTVRIAQEVGGIESLFPDGCYRLTDLPYTLHEAILSALTYNSWMTELNEDERPPRSIWAHQEKLEGWFAEVNRKRAEKYGLADSGREPIKDPVRNGATKYLIAD